MRRALLAVLAASLSVVQVATAQEHDREERPELDAKFLSGLEFRGIGPALMSGRITEIAIDPVERSTWYLAIASGGVWKTDNAGTTWTPIFDDEGSYSIGTVVVDPNDHLTVWVGTGENNSQRSVGYGDGLYKSIDGGRSFTNVGLGASEHIARVLIDPRNSDVVYVAAQGPLWAPGGDRGLYKTTDGGASWTKILEISENTGVTDVVFDPTNPDVLYAAAYQRRRHVWTLINGGPESGIYKSTDAGATWREINQGLPSGDKGRIGLAVSPHNTDVVYAIVEADPEKEGFFRSTDGGEHWSKQSDYVSGSPQYYQEIYADPARFDRIYSLDTYMMVSDDGGATFTRLGEEWKHVDNHAIVFDPEDPDHLLIGCDGGLYETWDRGENYRYFANLPITQFYKVAVDNDTPFYNVYGGTQDNATQGGPSRTTNTHGIRNSDWFVTVGGDGFDPAVDPEDPNIVYSQWQYGGLIRFDRSTGERIDVKPQEARDGPPLRWNWDSALLISPHSHTRLYYAAQMLFRSDDRGNTWRAVSGDLTRNLDRNQLPVMGRVWGVDAVAKNNSTSFYGTIVALTESPLVEDLLYAGTDDGLIQVTEDGGATWRRIEQVGDVPDMTYVNDLEASLHEANTVYAVLNNHKRGDFTPYVYKSTDRGRTWRSITGDLPTRGSTYTIAEDHEQPGLLFVGTEFGVFVTTDGGDRWIQLEEGIPTIAVRDLEIQRRESDLIAASFGRGFFILDDYSPLRHVSESMVTAGPRIFPVKPARWFVQDAPLGRSEKASQGAAFYTAPNPAYGATFTYYLQDSLKTRRTQRRAEERKLAKDGEDVSYPSWEALKDEDREEEPQVTLAVRDASGAIVRRIEGSTSAGIHRATWDFRYPGYTARSIEEEGYGPLALPGSYSVSLEQWVDGALTELVPPTPFDVQPLRDAGTSADERAAVLAFQRETGELQRVMAGTSAAADAAAERLERLKALIEVWPGADPGLRMDARTMELELEDLREILQGDPTMPRRSEPAMPGLLDRLSTARAFWSTTMGPTTTHREQFTLVREAFGPVYDALAQIVERDLPALEERVEASGAPVPTTDRLPRWPR
jgi:photosystem II stability/assembly factor-like uncharacterized protein